MHPPHAPLKKESLMSLRFTEPRRSAYRLQFERLEERNSPGSLLLGGALDDASLLPDGLGLGLRQLQPDQPSVSHVRLPLLYRIGDSISPKEAVSPSASSGNISNPISLPRLSAAVPTRPVESGAALPLATLV